MDKSKLEKWILGGLLLGTVLIASIILGLFLLAKYWMSPVEKVSQKINFVVEVGSNTSAIARKLKEAHLIRNDLAFRIYARYKGLDKKIQAGIYSLDPSLPLEKLVVKLLNNPTGITITLVEGWRREEMAAEIEKVFGGKNPNFSASEFVNLTENLEGQLFPDTYQFEMLASTQRIIEVLNTRYKNIISGLTTENQAVGYSDAQLMVLASLIEREAAREQDRGMVAGVIFNRLQAGMPLQIDATLQYIDATRQCGQKVECSDWWPEAQAEDKELVSPYNTYLVTGLPPRAIANPGLATLKAAYNPIASDNYYYLTDKSGITHYAATYDQHLANINQYLR